MAKTVWKRFVLILFSMLMSLSVFDIPRVEAASAPSSNSQYWYGATVMKTQQVTATSEVKITKSVSSSDYSRTTYYYVIPKGTVIGTVYYYFGTYKYPGKVDGKYLHGFGTTIFMLPYGGENGFTVSIYKDTSKWSRTSGVVESKTRIYDSTARIYNTSEVIVASTNIPLLGSNSSTTSATLMKGGASLYPYWTPSSTCIGKDSYSIAVGFGASASYSATGWAGSISGSASGSISFDKDYLTVTDNTNISTQKCGAKFDYIKSHLGYCASGRRKVVMGQTKQYIEYFWTTSDNSYNQTLNLACYFSVVDSKSWPNTLKTFSVSIPLVSKY